MVKISTALIVFFLLCTTVFVVLWIVSPETDWEPYATFLSAVLIPLVFLFQKHIDSINNDQSKEERMHHDRDVFNTLNELLDEDFVVRFVKETGGSERCKINDKGKLEHFVEEMEKSKYSLLTRDVEDKRAGLIECTTKVRDFLRYNFDSMDNPNLPYSKMCKPEDNPYSNREQYKHMNYGELSTTFIDLLWKLQDSYTEFRAEIKKNLYI